MFVGCEETDDFWPMLSERLKDGTVASHAESPAQDTRVEL